MRHKRRPMNTGQWTRDWVAKKDCLPKDWDKLVKKHADLVPNYVMY